MPRRASLSKPMMVSSADLEEVARELEPVRGGRIQRLDVVADKEFVLEIRHPGRTVRILICYRADFGRIHALADRPKKMIDGGELQRTLRRRLLGQPLFQIRTSGHTLILHLRTVRMEVRLKEQVLLFHPEETNAPSPAEAPSYIPERFPRSEALAARFASTSAHQADRLRADLKRRLGARQRKLDKLARNLASDLAHLRDLAQSRRLGEQLKGAGMPYKRGRTEVHVFDYELDAEVAVPLDPALDLTQNMARYFNRAKKADRGLPIVLRRCADVSEALARIAELGAQLEQADDQSLQTMAASLSEPARAGSPSSSSKRPAKKSPIDQVSRRFVAADGTEIRVGRGAMENDKLTFGFARGEDIWLHAAGTAGAHVLLRVLKGHAPNPDALYDAAVLAAHYSGARAGNVAEVTYTEARWVKKTKGDPAGRVSLAKPRILRVRIEELRVRRLFGQTLDEHKIV